MESSCTPCPVGRQLPKKKRKNSFGIFEKLSFSKNGAKEIFSFQAVIKHEQNEDLLHLRSHSVYLDF